MHANYSKNRSPIRLKTSLFRHRHQQNFFTHPQFVISKAGRGGRRYPPYAFTEQGVAMLSSVLGSDRAIAVNIEIMRAFVRMRELLSSNKELARRFAQLEARIDKKLAEHDEAITAILSAIRELMQPPTPKRGGIGFTADIDPKC
jgi:hypothetical protein